MTADNAMPPEPPLFCALLTPHRSLSGTGFLAVMLAIGGISFFGGIVFLMMGAWPIVGFLGLDVLLIYWAFRANYRAAAAYEEVLVTTAEIRVRRVSARGAVVEWAANPLWVRLDRDIHPEFGVQKLALVSRGRRFGIASFLGPEEKGSFADALMAALAEAKRGPVRTVLP